jgi:hypothetical protein
MIIENVQSENWFPLRFAVSVRYLVEELCTAMCNPIFVVWTLGARSNSNGRSRECGIVDTV